MDQVNEYRKPALVFYLEEGLQQLVTLLMAAGQGRKVDGTLSGGDIGNVAKQIREGLVVIRRERITQKEISRDLDIFMRPVNVRHFTKGLMDVRDRKGLADFRQCFCVYGFEADVDVGKKGQPVEVFE